MICILVSVIYMQAVADQLPRLGKGKQFFCYRVKFCGSFSEGFPLPLGASDGLRYLIVALPGPSI